MAREATLELGLTTYLDGLNVNGKTSLAVVRIGTDLQTLVNTHGAVVRVRQTSGQHLPREDRPRVGIEVYANTYSDVWVTATQVQKLMLRPYFNAGGYPVDYCLNESANAEQAHPNLRLVTSVWRVVTRALATP